MRYLILILIAGLLWPVQGWGATVYVDPDCSNNGDGTTFICASSGGAPGAKNTWASMTWTLGNTYLQKGGSTYTGAAIIVDRSGGTGESHRILVGSYDGTTGQRTTGGTNRAKIDGTGVARTLRIWPSTHYVTFDNWEVYDTDGAGGTEASFGVYFGSNSTSVSNNTVLSNLYIHDILKGSTSVSRGIQGTGTNITINACIISGVPDDGVWIRGENIVITNTRISDVSKENTDGDCIQLNNEALLYHTSARIANCYLDHSAKEAKQVVISANEVGATSSGLLVENNIMIMATYSAIATAVVHTQSANSIIRNNTMTGGYHGVYVNPAASGVLINNNIITGSAYSAVTYDSTGGMVYNNNLIGVRGLLVANTKSLTSQNNIYSGTTADVRVNDGGGVVGGYSIFVNDSSASLGTASTYTDTGTTDKYETDPLFVNAAGGDFRLKANSPARNAGVYINGPNGITHDALNRPIPKIGE